MKSTMRWMMRVLWLAIIAAVCVTVWFRLNLARAEGFLAGFEAGQAAAGAVVGNGPDGASMRVKLRVVPEPARP